MRVYKVKDLAPGQIFYWGQIPGEQQALEENEVLKCKPGSNRQPFAFNHIFLRLSNNYCSTFPVMHFFFALTSLER